ncbi:MAG: hypothetical protein ABIP51_06810 [Bacteroidia bacterium]
MNTIAIIDDKDAIRKPFARQISNVLERLYPDWKVIERRPFMAPAEYPQWIIENEISVLILDEQLDGEAIENGKSVDYNGHNLVKELRVRFKDLPVYSITAVAVSDDLKKSLPYFNLILSTRDFDDDTDNYINLFVKSGINFYNEYQSQLERLGILSEKIARGIATSEELTEATGLQTKLEIPNTVAETSNRENYLSKLEENLEEVKKISTQISELIKSKGK